MSEPINALLRQPADIPNRAGFRFVGVTKDAQFVWLCVQEAADGSYTLGDGVYSTLDSWLTVEDFQKYVLPAVEGAR